MLRVGDHSKYCDNHNYRKDMNNVCSFSPHIKTQQHAYRGEQFHKNLIKLS